MSPPSSCLCISGISHCVIRIGLRSLEDGRPQRRMAPRRMSLRRMSLRRMAPRRRKAETDVPEAEGVLLVLLPLKILEAMLEWMLLLFSFEYCVWVQQYVRLVEDRSCVWVNGRSVGCVWVRVDQGKADKARFVV